MIADMIFDETFTAHSLDYVLSRWASFHEREKITSSISGIPYYVRFLINVYYILRKQRSGPITVRKMSKFT